MIEGLIAYTEVVKLNDNCDYPFISCFNVFFS